MASVILMACYHPLSAWRDPASGSIMFQDRGAGDRIDLPCGRCIGCRLEKSRQWATRIMFESQMHDANSFLTLTYSDEFLPNPPSLVYRDYQLFMKRFRKAHGAGIRFYMCGEYGDQDRRPHYHACIFGHDFSDDRYQWSRNYRGDILYRSPALERLWPYGHSLIGDLTFDSAAYVARYQLKKVTGDQAQAHYEYVSPDGEISQLEPEFARMSLRPGIGGLWFDRFSDDVYRDHDFVVVNGHRCRPPRYFDRLLRRADRDRYDAIKFDRSVVLTSEHNTDRRLADREVVQLAAISNLKRS